MAQSLKSLEEGKEIDLDESVGLHDQLTETLKN